MWLDTQRKPELYLIRYCFIHLPTLYRRSRPSGLHRTPVRAVSGGQQTAGAPLIAYLTQVHVDLHDEASGVGRSVLWPPIGQR